LLLQNFKTRQYLLALDAINRENYIEIHEEDFRNASEKTTNLIEGMWSQLKTKIATKKASKKMHYPIS